MQSRALSQMATATKKYPRFFHPHEVQSMNDIDNEWETVSGDDPDVFILPAAVPAGLTSANQSFTRRIEDIAEESGIYDVGPSSVRPRNSVSKSAAARREAMLTVPDHDEAQLVPETAFTAETVSRPSYRQPSRPDYAEDPFQNLVPVPSPLTAPPIAMFSAVPLAPEYGAADPMNDVPLPQQHYSAPAPSRAYYRSYQPQSQHLPPASQPLSGYVPNSTAGAVYSVGQPPPSLLATMGPRKQRSFGMYVAAIGAFALAATGIFGGQTIAKGGHHFALHHSVAALKAPAVAPAAAPPAVSSDAPAMDLGAALGNTSLAPASPVPVAAPPAALKPAPSASAAKKEPVGVRAKAALDAGNFSEASLLYAEMTENATGRLEGAIGLAEVARARGDNRAAAARYKEILVNYPAYLPARLGLADATWDSGDEAAAGKMYVGLQKTYATKMLPPRVAERSRP